MILSKDNLRISCENKVARKFIEDLVKEDYGKQVYDIRQIEEHRHNYHRYVLILHYGDMPLTVERDVVMRCITYDDSKKYEVVDEITHANEITYKKHYLI